MTQKLKTLTLAVLTVLSVLLAGLSVGGIAAAQETDTAELPQDRTFEVNNNTESVRAVAINTSGPLDVSVTAVYENGTETEVDTGTLDTSDSTDNAATYAYQIPDSKTGPDYRVNVSDGSGSTADASTAEEIEIEKLQAMSGGAGGLLPSGGNNLPIYVVIGLALVAAVALIASRDDGA